MRGVFVRNVGVGILALALTVLASCDDNPLSFDVKDTTGITVNPSSMVLTSGRTAQIFSRTVNQGMEPTYEVITAERDATCGDGAITVEPDNDIVPAEPPGRFDVTAGSTLGTTCVVLTGGGATAQVDVAVVGGDIEITNSPGTVRAGDTGTLEARLVDADGNEVGPYDVTATTWTSDNEDAVDVSAGGGAYTTAQAGTGVVTVSWLGLDSDGTSGLGVEITDDAPIEVTANIPANAYYAVTGDTTASIGLATTGQVVEFVVTVADAFGNLNTVPIEIDGVTIFSSDPAVATATADIVTDDPDLGEGDVPVVTVTTVAAGVTTIAGFVTVSTGTDLPFTGVYTILPLEITSFGPDDGTVGEVMQIQGTGLTNPVFMGELTLNGDTINPIFIISETDTQIDFFMPDIGDALDTVAVTVVMGTASAEEFEYTQLLNAALDEPANDSPFTPTDIASPVDLVGSFEGLEVDDFYLINVPVASNIDIVLDWDDHSVDLDILFDDEGLPFNFPCDFPGATGAAPEFHNCDVPAGNYLIWINNFSAAPAPTSYRLTVVVQ